MTTTPGTGTGLRTDTKVDPRYGPVVQPIVREMVAIYVKADIDLNWQMIEYAHQYKEKSFSNDSRPLKKAIREELEKHYSKEDAGKKSYYLNRAVLIAYTMTREEVTKAKEEGKTFNNLLGNTRNPNTKTRDKQNSTRVENSLTEDGQNKPAPAKKTEQQGVNLSPGDNEIPVDDLVDKIDAWIDNSKTRAVILMQILVEKTWIKKALQEIYKEKEKES